MTRQKKAVKDTFSDRLLTWFDKHGRKDLPWQTDKSPYRVWVSEIMLQQTQVATVINYYLKFMASFPTLESLANADQDRVLEHWAGLGYYARARNLHKAAKTIMNDYEGIFPDTLESLVSLPGIGRSTAGAILSIAHKKYAYILDGNVKRVLCRYHAIETWSGERKTEQHLWQLAEQHTPSERTDEYTQAIMDLGATLCTRSKPNCNRCPMIENCAAFKKDLQHALPKSKPKKVIPQKKVWALYIESKQGLLLQKRPPSGIWGGLYSLPEAPPSLSLDELEEYCASTFGLKVMLLEKHQSIHHTFSHYKLEIQPVKFTLIKNKHEIKSNDSYNWLTKEEVNSVALPAPISNYLSAVLEESLFN